MSVGVIVSLIILGIILLIIEFLIIPGVTIAGIAGTLFVIGGVIAGYIFHKPPVSHFIAAGSIIMTVALFVIAFKTNTWQHFALKTSIDGHSHGIEVEEFKIGDTGVTITRLGPVGKVMINDKMVEARSLGGIIDPNIPITVIRTEKNKLFVEPLK